MSLFEQKVNSFIKFFKKVSPEIAISGFHKIWSRKTDSFTIHTKNNFKFRTEQNRLNRFSHQLLGRREGGSLEVPTKYVLFYKKRFFSIQNQYNFYMN